MSLRHKGLNQRLWQHARRAAMDKDNHRCVKCGRAGKLEVHHVTPLFKGGKPYALDNLKTLCRDCHLEHSVFGPRLEWRRHVSKQLKELHQ